MNTVTFNIDALKNSALSRPEGYLQDILNHGTINYDDNNNIISVTLSEIIYELLKSKYRHNYKIQNMGVGSQLKKLLGNIGITAGPSCPCHKNAQTMDDNGIDWCEQNISIIVEWMRESARQRRLPFIEYAAKILVKKAIKNARKIEQQLRELNNYV